LARAVGRRQRRRRCQSAKRDKIVIGMSGDGITERGEQLDAASRPARNEGCGSGSQGRPGDYTAPTLPGFTCGDIEGDFAAWNASLLVTSSADAATALRVLEQMKHYDVAGYLGVSVSPMPCFGAPPGRASACAR
jgi:hypothetical protein